MTKNRLIGRSKTYTQFDKSGVFTTNELTGFNYENRDLRQKTSKNPPKKCQKKPTNSEFFQKKLPQSS